VAEVPPVTDVGLTVRFARVTGAGGLTVSVADRDTPPAVAVTVTAVVVETALVVAVNVAEEAPAGTVTVPGIATAALPLARATTRPPAGAGALSVTVPWDVPPPVTVDGAKLSAEAAAAGAAPGSTHSTVRSGRPVSSALIIAAVDLATADVVTGNDTRIAPAGTVTVAGTDATAGLLLLRLMTNPPAGAGRS
jgi:hypothetical protein